MIKGDKGGESIDIVYKMRSTLEQEADRRGRFGGRYLHTRCISHFSSSIIQEVDLLVSLIRERLLNHN